MAKASKAPVEKPKRAWEPPRIKTGQLFESNSLSTMASEIISIEDRAVSSSDDDAVDIRQYWDGRCSQLDFTSKVTKVIKNGSHCCSVISMLDVETETFCSISLELRLKRMELVSVACYYTVCIAVQEWISRVQTIP